MIRKEDVFVNLTALHFICVKNTRTHEHRTAHALEICAIILPRKKYMEDAIIGICNLPTEVLYNHILTALFDSLLRLVPFWTYEDEHGRNSPVCKRTRPIIKAKCLQGLCRLFLYPSEVSRLWWGAIQAKEKILERNTRFHQIYQICFPDTTLKRKLWYNECKIKTMEYKDQVVTWVQRGKTVKWYWHKATIIYVLKQNNKKRVSKGKIEPLKLHFPTE